jgi:hypothetical protein
LYLLPCNKQIGKETRFVLSKRESERFGMRKEIERICQLQPYYSPDNTPEMQERGRLIRGALVNEIRQLSTELSTALGEFGNEFLVEASDGIGRKTELPWVRFGCRRMSPAATEGFYAVLHFSTDGSAFHITVGCGSSKFHNGSSVPLPDKELDKQTAWARTVLTLEQLDPCRAHSREPRQYPIGLLIKISKLLRFRSY